jgi:hypothetical protein
MLMQGVSRTNDDSKRNIIVLPAEINPQVK